MNTARFDGVNMNRLWNNSRVNKNLLLTKAVLDVFQENGELAATLAPENSSH